MDIDEIRKLIELMEEKGVSELEIKDANGEVRLVLGSLAPTSGVSTQPPVVHVPQAPEAVATRAPAATENHANVREQDGVEAGLTITSPMVGTFYLAPSPDANPFVNVGDVVENGDVVCIIEAMKMMNEIESELRGRLRSVLVQNGQPVEYGQTLFLLEPI